MVKGLRSTRSLSCKSSLGMAYGPCSYSGNRASAGATCHFHMDSLIRFIIYGSNFRLGSVWEADGFRVVRVHIGVPTVQIICSLPSRCASTNPSSLGHALSSSAWYLSVKWSVLVFCTLASNAGCHCIPRLTRIVQVDIPLLYRPVTDQALENAYSFYEIWYEAPGAVKVSSVFLVAGLAYNTGTAGGEADSSSRRCFMSPLVCLWSRFSSNYIDGRSLRCSLMGLVLVSW